MDKSLESDRVDRLKLSIRLHCTSLCYVAAAIEGNDEFNATMKCRNATSIRELKQRRRHQQRKRHLKI